MDDYFAAEPVYSEAGFERRFRMPRSVFNRIRDELFALPFFQKNQDAIGIPGIRSLQKLLAALQMCSTGLAGDAVDEYVRISAPSALKSLK